MVAMAAGPGDWLGPAFGLRLLLASVLHAVSVIGAEFSSEACRELGFSSNLLCSSCDLLGQFNLLQLDPDCKGCCQEEAQFETKKVMFSSISLPVDGLVDISCMQELFLKSVDENWGGSLKSKLSSGVINPNYSEDYKSSMFVVQTLY
ncbi:PREDICTED: 15 kDa selenoprotein isoform X2 [Hipposideros armiger]|uniref:15 kDa selenoprotein isoform X2 n=1 Tax=Hipposideros armiger TaxID=186990 RepID=A0A8B7SQ02_HIPAR|nr:PREDICTED: 15 kDa selenoprotein isoform X2 [Hipposideros armiger]